jgi:transcription elongation factor S-II
MALDAKQVDRKRLDLDKALKDGAPASTITVILNELKTGVVPSEKLLRETKIGVAVNKLRQFKDPAVAKLSTEIVNGWRTAMQKSKSAGGSTPKTANATNGTASPAPNGGSSASPEKKAVEVKPEKKKFQGDTAKRNTKTDNVNTNVSGNTIRDNCLKLMYDGLAFMSSECKDVLHDMYLSNANELNAVSEDILAKARDVENATYKEFQPETSEAYKSKIRSLFQNLKNKSNRQLSQRVFSGEIKPEEFVVMSSEDLKSEERKKQDEDLKKENMNNAMVAQEEYSISSEFVCGKCKQKKVSYKQAQTRSADEPMTTFCTCMNCGNRWKFS